MKKDKNQFWDWYVIAEKNGKLVQYQVYFPIMCSYMKAYELAQYFCYLEKVEYVSDYISANPNVPITSTESFYE